LLYFRPILVLALIILILGIIFFAWQFTWNGAIDLSVNVEWNQQILIIKGKTTLPDTAILSYEIGPADENTLAEEGIYASGIAVVKKGQYSTQLDTSLFPPGDIKVWVLFQLESTGRIQPPEIVNRYGVYGQYLKGKHVIKENDHYRLEVSKVIPKN